MKQFNSRHTPGFMKTMKLLLIALMLGIGALSSVKAAVVIDTTLNGWDAEYIDIYDSEYNIIGGYSSSYWEVEALVYDDQEGEIEIRWLTPSGITYMRYAVGANASYLTVIEGTDLLGFNAASMALFSLLYL